jgi:hypothetical protein
MTAYFTEEVVFVIVVATPQDLSSSRVLIDSLRSFGGLLGGAEVLLFEADARKAPCGSLEGERVRVVPLAVPDRFQGFLFSEKVWACREAERLMPPGTNSVAYLTPQSLIVRPPVELHLTAEHDVALRPVHIRNVGLPVEEPLDAFWRGVYDSVGIGDTASTVESFVDGQRIRAYFNTGVFSINPGMGLLRRWSECFGELVSNRRFQASACGDVRHKIFLHQAVFSAIVARDVPEERIWKLSPEYSYPYHLQRLVPAARRAAVLNDLVCPVFEDHPPDPGSMDDIEVREPLRSWLAARVRPATP